MPVLKAPPKQPKTTVVQLRLDDEARMKLTKYAEFLDGSPSYVVSEALKLVCNKDKEFQSWLAALLTSAGKGPLNGCLPLKKNREFSGLRPLTCAWGSFSSRRLEGALTAKVYRFAGTRWISTMP